MFARVRLCPPQFARAVTLARVRLSSSVLALAIGGTICAAGLGAQASDTLHLHRLTGPITLDGLSDEPAWAQVEPLPMTMYAPVFGQPITERTEIRVAYDDTHLYLGARMYDSEPQSIRTNTLYRDAFSGDDLIAIVLDTYNDHETAAWFVVNPAAARTDRAVSNDAEFTGGTFPMNADWNAFWDAATQVTAEGWFAEIRIPFSSLGFQDTDGRVVMGLIVYRFIARKNERQVHPAIPPNWGLSWAKPSQARRIVMEGVYRRRPVYVTPYGLGGARRDANLPDGSPGYVFQHDATHEAGLDVRLSPASNLTLDLSVNTDFAQVEVDDQQVNLTRFNLFFPEKRQFFQTRAAIFEFSTGGFDRLFHSRHIGLVNEEPVRLLGGARLVGRAGLWDVGLLNMQTARSSTTPGENFGAARLRRQVLNQYSTVGSMVTTRIGDDGSYNVAAGVDASLRVVGDEYVTLKFARTFDGDHEGVPLPSLDAARIMARWERRNQIGLGYSAELIRSGQAYQPGLGFTFRHDYTSFEPRLRYQWLGGAGVPYRTLGLNANAEVYRRNADGTVESAAVEPGFQLELKGGAEISVDLRSTYESVSQPFDLAEGVFVPAGDYWFRSVNLRHMASRAASFRPTFSVAAGQFFDGTLVSIEATPAWNPSRYLELGVDYSFNAIRFPDRGQGADIHVGRFRIQAAYNIHLSLATFVQYNSAADLASVNARLRYHFSEGRDLWIVYNETVNTYRPEMSLRPPFSQARALMVKYSHTFVW